MAAISRTIIKIKQDKEAEVEDYIDQKASEISSIPGIKNWGVIYTDENATAFVNEVMADFAPLVAAQPVRKIFDARWN